MNQQTMAWGLGLSLMLWVPAVWSQGQIAFGNRVPSSGIDAQVFDTDCRTRLAGPAFLAQLYFGREPDSLAPVDDPRPFRTGAAAGYFLTVSVTIPDTSGLPLFFRVRAWEAAAGSSYVEAMASGKYGESNLVVATPSWPPGAPTELIRPYKLLPRSGAPALAPVAPGGRARRPTGSAATPLKTVP